MGKFVLIGGGECGRPGTVYETETLDREIISLTGKRKPNFLLIAFASQDPEFYYEVMDKVYGSIWNCPTDRLKLSDLNTYEVMEKKIAWADIIYVGGGNTLKLMKTIRKYHIDRLLYKAYKSNKVLCGVSAGAICWCEYGNSDSRNPFNVNREIIRVKCLGFVPILFCPHYNLEKRKLSLEKMMQKTFKVPAIAVENGAAVEIVDEQFRVITCFDDAKATKCYWKNSCYFERNIEKDVFYQLSELYRKE